MNDNDRSQVYSEIVKAGKRIYYFDVKQTKNGDKFVTITESKRIAEGTPDNPHFSYEKHKIFVYKEDYEKFITALLRTVEMAKPEGTSQVQPNNVTTTTESNQDGEAQASDDPLSVELDF